MLLELRVRKSPQMINCHGWTEKGKKDKFERLCWRNEFNEDDMCNAQM
jgi:hypothetical protein